MVLQIIRILIALVFITSAIAKLPEIEFFEIDLVRSGISSWTLAPFLARFIIVIEFIAGTLLLFNYMARQVALPLIVSMLISFSIYLGWSLIKEGNRDDCGCFGILMKMSPMAALIKNIILLSFSLWVFKKLKRKEWKRKWILYLLVPVSIATVFIIIPVSINTGVHITSSKKILFTEITSFNKFQSSFKEEKKAVAFFSATCSHCKQLALKLKVLQLKEGAVDNIYFVFFGETNEVSNFMKENDLRFPYVILPPSQFFSLAGFSVPRLFLMDGEEVVYELSNKSFNPDLIHGFFTNE